jgi:hypothetical protein
MNNSFESPIEKNLTKEDVVGQIHILLADSEVLRLLGVREFPYSGEALGEASSYYNEGDPEPYLVEIPFLNGLTGERADFYYNRAGEYPKSSSASTSIHIYYYDKDGIPCGSDDLATYEPSNGIWKSNTKSSQFR